MADMDVTDKVLYKDLGRKVTRFEYDKTIEFALDLGVKNGFMQEGGTVGESFIPAFDLEGVEHE